MTIKNELYITEDISKDSNTVQSVVKRLIGRK